MRLRPTVPSIALLALAALAGCSKKATAPPPTATVSGMVLHLDGSRYAGALVDAQTLQPVDGTFEITTVTSDTSGAFTFTGLRPAAYTISVIELDSLAVADTVTAPASGVALRLEPGVVLRGVALRPGGTDQTGIIVSIDLPTAFGLTDTAGAYEILGVAPGARVVTATDLLGGGRASIAVTAVAGDTLQVDTLRAATPAPFAVRPASDAVRRARAAAPADRGSASRPGPVGR